MVYVIHGDNAFLREQKLRALLSDARKEGADIVSFEAPNEIGNALRFAEAQTLFGAPRMVLVKQSDALLKEHEASCVELARAGKKNSPVVFFCSGAAPDWLLKKMKHAVSLHFPRLERRALDDRAVSYANECGISLELGAVEKLRDACESDTLRISREVEKLASWKPGGRIGAEDLSWLSAAPPNIFFSFVDALLARQRAAPPLLLRILADGNDPHKLLVTLTNTFRILALAKQVSDSGELRKILGEGSPFWISKIAKSAQNFSSQELKRAYFSLVRAEYAIKTGAGEPAPLLEEFVRALSLPSRVRAQAATSFSTREAAS